MPQSTFAAPSDSMRDPVFLVQVSCHCLGAVAFSCSPVSCLIVRTSAQTGHTFERKNIEDHLAISSRVPLSGVHLTNKTLVPNYALRHAIEHYLAGQSADTSQAARVDPCTSFDPSPPARKMPEPTLKVDTVNSMSTYTALKHIHSTQAHTLQCH